MLRISCSLRVLTLFQSTKSSLTTSYSAHFSLAILAGAPGFSLQGKRPSAWPHRAPSFGLRTTPHRGDYARSGRRLGADRPSARSPDSFFTDSLPLARVCGHAPCRESARGAPLWRSPSRSSFNGIKRPNTKTRAPTSSQALAFLPSEALPCFALIIDGSLSSDLCPPPIPPCPLLLCRERPFFPQR